MILKIAMIYLIIAITVNDVSGAALSKVFVQSGSEYVPVEYVQYEVPTISLAGSQIGRISMGSIGQVIPVPSAGAEGGLVATCAMPCPYPGQVVSAVAPISPSDSNIYKSSVPVVIPSNEETPGYEYSYNVYDKNTGDHKYQYELSDGSVIHGEYSLLQPDGYIREVTYVADDARGFNAFVKHYLPEEEQKKKDFKETTDEIQPSLEVKNKVPETAESNKKQPVQETNQKLSALPIIEENKEINKTSDKSDRKDISDEINQKVLEINPTKNLESKELKGNLSEQPLTEIQKYIKPVKIPESIASPFENKKEAEESKEQTKDIVTPVPKTEKPPQLGLEYTDIFVPYSNIIKCFESAVNSGKVPGITKSESPLTYIILNKPC